ncbi:hypothetical protein HQ945_21785 [Phyllobacterium sp. BT25]|uniref:Uncharacterized protein n=1 Tax=Phyllobacterium pellucidum TaxID=2740464 RepID=A0A849VV78_9HYPH|nr:hypothetical protein [Phyllobacterium pellucidum]NTS33895.1 hypothetical protein [Phyllobacterium pellucidum]
MSIEKQFKKWIREADGDREALASSIKDWLEAANEADLEEFSELIAERLLPDEDEDED